MARHVWSVLCTKTVTDKNTNLVSMIEVIDEVTFGFSIDDPNFEKTKVFTKPIAAPVNWELVSLLTRSERTKPEIAPGQMNILSPDESVLASLDFTGDLQAAARNRITIKLAGIPIKEAGTHHFQIMLKDATDTFQEVARIPLDVILDVQSGKSD